MYYVSTANQIVPIGELTGDATSSIGQGNGNAAIWSVGGLNTTAEFDGSISFSHSIVKTGTGAWTLTSTGLSYTGQTTVSNGVLVLGASATLPASTPITLVAPGILDVSAAGTFNLGATVAQTMQGNGTLNGSLNVGATGTVSPGGANRLATLTVTNDANLAGTIVMELNRTNTPATNDMLTATTIEMGGTLQVNNIGPDLHTGDTFKLFSVPATGAFAVTNLPVTTGNGSITYVWTNKLSIDGTIQVLVGAPNINTNAFVMTNSFDGVNLTLSWPVDHTGYRLQVQTNTVATGLGTNWVTVPGSTQVNLMVFPVSGGNGSVFSRLIYPCV
jgi:autotransporter-associated beta strand protein